jgi:hypothetical protein
MTTTIPDHTVTGRIYNIKPCPYCREDITAKEILIDDICRLLLVENSLLVILPEHMGVFVDARINYCPMCGRRLKAAEREK